MLYGAILEVMYNIWCYTWKICLDIIAIVYILLTQKEQRIYVRNKKTSTLRVVIVKF